MKRYRMFKKILCKIIKNKVNRRNLYLLKEKKHYRDA